ncbi:MAG: PAS domain-containing sensor histidine kinase [Lachnospiraceae bacterium]|nr:PAS domain-containing sensor histidine kinase [Lachnospiraceae bacterium]
MQKKMKIHIKYTLLTLLLMTAGTAISFLLFSYQSFNTGNIALIYILMLILIVWFTEGYFYWIFAATIAVICINYLFTYPFRELNFTLSGYPVSFLFMFTILSISSAAVKSIKRQGQILKEREVALAAAEKEKMRANLLRAISHDLRTPLTSIIGASYSYLENEDSLDADSRRDLVSHINEDSNWLLHMVENLLSVTRIGSEGTSITTSSEPVEEVLSEAVSRVRKRLPDLKINVRVPENFLMVPMDAILIEQVIINLVENAAIHGGGSRPIECHIEDSDNCVIFRVRDYGNGIPEAKLETIFDGTSYSSDQSDGHRGMGIGLSICKTIITAHKGTIEAINHTDGAEFYFTLPKEEEHST